MFDNRKKLILAIDDDVTTLSIMRTVLEGSFDVSLAKNAEIAKTILHSSEVDMILLDLEMPGLSGINFLTAIHENTSFYHIPIIIVSSHGTPDIIIKAKKIGAIDFVVKPVSPKALLEKIHAAFKVSPQKISKELLIRKLGFLKTICEEGKSGRVDELTEELEHLYFDMATDLELSEICNLAKKMDYNLAVIKMGDLLKRLERL